MAFPAAALASLGSRCEPSLARICAVVRRVCGRGSEPGVDEMSIDPMVAGTDGSASAELAVDKAAELAQALAARVHVVSAYSSSRRVRGWVPRP